MAIRNRVMPPDSTPAIPLRPETGLPERPGLIELFVAFAKMSLAGFGGVLVWARRAIVEQHRWMTPEEFSEAFALCHFLSGPNIVNLSVVFGARSRYFRKHRGLPGPGRASGGHRHRAGRDLRAIRRDICTPQRTLAGVSCAAVGLFLAVIARMMMPAAEAARSGCSCASDCCGCRWCRSCSSRFHSVSW
jgi:chromate transporter